MNQCWHHIWYSLEDKFRGNAQDIKRWRCLKNRHWEIIIINDHISRSINPTKNNGLTISASITWNVWLPLWNWNGDTFNPLWPCDTMCRHGAGSTISIGSSNGLLPDGTNPSPEPVFTNHLLSPVTLIGGQFYKRYLSHQSPKLL